MAKTRELKLGGGEHRDLVLAALGMLSASARLDDLLLLGRQDEPLADDDPVVLAALGALSLRRSLRRWLALAASEGAHDEPAEAPIPLPPEMRR